jgi:hypothetical protein
MCDTKYKVGDEVLCGEQANRKGKILFIDTNKPWPLLVLIEPSPSVRYYDSFWLKDDEVRPLPIKVTSVPYRRCLMRSVFKDHESVIMTVSKHEDSRGFERASFFIGWVDKDWITSEIEVTPR